MVRTRSMGAGGIVDEAYLNLPEQTKQQQTRRRSSSGANRAEICVDSSVISSVETSETTSTSSTKNTKLKNSSKAKPHDNDGGQRDDAVHYLGLIKTPKKGQMVEDLSPSPVKASTRSSSTLNVWLNYLGGLVSFIFLNAASILAYRVALIYLAWIGAHWAATHLYSTHCVPKSFTGFFQSIAYTPTPVCSGLRWVIYNGGESISAAWLVVGGACLTHLRTITKIK